MANVYAHDRKLVSIPTYHEPWYSKHAAGEHRHAKLKGKVFTWPILKKILCDVTVTMHVDTGTGKQDSFSVNEVRSTATYNPHMVNNTYWPTCWHQGGDLCKIFAWCYNHQTQQCNKIVDVEEQILLIRSQRTALNSFYTFVFWLLCSTFIILSWPHRFTVFIWDDAHFKQQLTQLRMHRHVTVLQDLPLGRWLLWIHIVGVSTSVISPCTIKSRRRFLLAPAHPGSVTRFNQATGYATRPLGIRGSISGVCPKTGQIGRAAAGRASSIKIGGWGRIAD